MSLAERRWRGGGRRTEPRPHGLAQKRGDESAREGPALFGSFSRPAQRRDVANTRGGRAPDRAQHVRDLIERGVFCSAVAGAPLGCGVATPPRRAGRGGAQQSPWSPSSRSSLLALRRSRGRAPHGGLVVAAGEVERRVDARAVAPYVGTGRSGRWRKTAAAMLWGPQRWARRKVAARHLIESAHSSGVNPQRSMRGVKRRAGTRARSQCRPNEYSLRKFNRLTRRQRHRISAAPT